MVPVIHIGLLLWLAAIAIIIGTPLMIYKTFGTKVIEIILLIDAFLMILAKFPPSVVHPNWDNYLTDKKWEIVEKIRNSCPKERKIPLPPNCKKALKEKDEFNAKLTSLINTLKEPVRSYPLPLRKAVFLLEKIDERLETGFKKAPSHPRFDHNHIFKIEFLSNILPWKPKIPSKSHSEEVMAYLEKIHRSFRITEEDINKFSPSYYSSYSTGEQNFFSALNPSTYFGNTFGAGFEIGLYGFLFLLIIILISIPADPHREGSLLLEELSFLFNFTFILLNVFGVDLMWTGLKDLNPGEYNTGIILSEISLVFFFGIIVLYVWATLDRLDHKIKGKVKHA